MWELHGHSQHYQWGSTDALPAFLGLPADGRPWAEIWFGAHHAGPAHVVTSGSGAAALPLDSLISSEPHQMLGPLVSRGFDGKLPFLLKVIAPAAPLSLQVHPHREHAAESFAAENAAALPVDSPARNYRDANHKPEMVVALERFEALCGFRTPRRAASIVAGLGTPLTDRIHALLVDQPNANGMRAAFRMIIAPILRSSHDAVHEVAAACADRYAAGKSPSPRIDRTVALLNSHFPGDPGVVAALLLNPVTLSPGEAMYVPAGTIHAYLSGLAVEVMASSDNVLRAGLTAKKVDVGELMQCVSVVAAPPLRVAPERLSPTTVAYYAPVDDFELLLSTVEDGDHLTGAQHPLPGSGPRVLLGLSGEVLVESQTGQQRVSSGRALFVPASAGMLRIGGSGRIVQANVP